MSESLRLSGQAYCQTQEQLIASKPLARVLHLYNAQNGTSYQPEDLITDYALASDFNDFFQGLNVSGRVKELDRIHDLRTSVLEEIKGIDLDRQVPFVEANERLERAAGYDLRNALTIMQEYYTGEKLTRGVIDWPENMEPLLERQLQMLEVEMKNGDIDQIFWDGKPSKHDSVLWQEALRKASSKRNPVENYLRHARSLTKEALQALAAAIASGKSQEQLTQLVRSHLQAGQQSNKKQAGQWLGFKTGTMGYKASSQGGWHSLSEVVQRTAEISEKVDLLTLESYLNLTSYLKKLERDFNTPHCHQDFLSYQVENPHYEYADNVPVIRLSTVLNEFTPDGRPLQIQGDAYSRLAITPVTGAINKPSAVFAQRNIFVL